MTAGTLYAFSLLSLLAHLERAVVMGSRFCGGCESRRSRLPSEDVTNMPWVIWWDLLRRELSCREPPEAFDSGLEILWQFAALCPCCRKISHLLHDSLCPPDREYMELAKKLAHDPIPKPLEACPWVKREGGPDNIPFYVWDVRNGRTREVTELLSDQECAKY